MKRCIVSTCLAAGLVGSLPGQTFTISTIAGSTNNTLGDGGNAATAVFIQPQGVAVDLNGNIYVSDQGGAIQAPSRVRKIDAATGNISTLTVTATSPTGLAVDPLGKYLYVAGQNSHRIWRVDTTTGAATTFAGTGSADMGGDGHPATTLRVRQPQCVWVAPNNDVFFCDTLNSRIHRVDADTGIMSLVAGRGQSNATVNCAAVAADLISKPPTPAIAAAACGTQSSALVENNPAGDGGLAVKATLFNPAGVIGDAEGNIYIADTGSNRIRKVDAATHIISTVVGRGVTSVTLGLSAGAAGSNATTIIDNVDARRVTLNKPKGLAWNANGDLLIVDAGGNRVRSWNLKKNQVRTIAGGGNKATDDINAQVSQLSNPTSVAVDAAGNILITDTDNSRVRKIDSATGIIYTAYGASQGRGDGGLASMATFNNPRGVAVADDGTIYVSDTKNHKVRRITPDGMINGWVGTGTSGFLYPENNVGAATTRLSSPGCVAVDAYGNLYIADRVNSRIRRVDSVGTISTVAGATNLTTNAKTGAVTGAQIATGYNNDGISAVLSRVGLKTSGGGIFAAGTATNSSGPNCVSVDGAGNMYIADTNNHVIRKVTSSGMITTVVGFLTTTTADDGISTNSGTSGSAGDGGLAINAFLNAPQGVGVNRAGTLLCIADTGNHAVRLVDLNTGIINLIAGIIPDGGSDALPREGWTSRLNGVQGCAVDDKGNTYIADTINNRITMVNPAGTMSLIAGGGTNFASDGKPATQATLTLPTGINVDNKGNVYFTDRFGLIKKLTPTAK